jgi:hypothetical protein
MREVVEPPADVPILRSGDTRVAVIASDWRIGGSRVVETPDVSPDWMRLPIAVAARDLVVETEVEPMVIHVRSSSHWL